MKTKFDTGERVLVPAKVNCISIEGKCIEYYVTAEKGYIGPSQFASMYIKEENLVGLADYSESLQMKLRKIVTSVNESPDHRLAIESDGKGKIVNARLEVRG